MNEQLKALIWKLDREIWAKVEAKEATTSWAREGSAKLIQAYSDQQNKELRERLAQEDEKAVFIERANAEIQRLTKELELCQTGNSDLQMEVGEKQKVVVVGTSEELYQFLKDNPGVITMREITTLRKEVETLNKSVDSWVEISTIDQNEITRLTKEVEELKKDKESLEKQAATFSEVHKMLNDRIKEDAKEIENLQKAPKIGTDCKKELTRLRELLVRSNDLISDYEHRFSEFDPNKRDLLVRDIDNALNHKP